MLHTGLDLLTPETDICANMQVLTLHTFLRTLFIFFNDVVNQRKRLICISLRADSVKMTRSNWVTRLFYLLRGLFMQRPLGIPAQAEAPVAPRSCPEMRNMSSEAPGSCTQSCGCWGAFLAPGRSCPHSQHLLANTCIMWWQFRSWLRHVNHGWFFPPFFVVLKNQTNNHLLIFSHLPFFPALSFSLTILASFCHFLSHLNPLR